MKITVCAIVLLAFTAPAAATYSIVARDPKTGELGVAVQSHWFAVGAEVTWAEAGVGAVATQANIEKSYGPQALALLRAGKSAKEALAILLAKDPGRQFRQVAIVDAQGSVAAHTGDHTMPFAGHHLGPGFSAQANIMANAQVWPAMSRAFESSTGPLGERLLAALDAAQAAGGDVRGKQSAAILIVGRERDDHPFQHVRVDLRVDDSREPLVELRRLLRLSRAYERASAGDALTAKSDFAGATAAYVEASRLAPENDELMFWSALSLAAVGKVEEAATTMQRVFQIHAGWRTLLPKLRAYDSPGAPVLQKKLGLVPLPR